MSQVRVPQGEPLLQNRSFYCGFLRFTPHRISSALFIVPTFMLQLTKLLSSTHESLAAHKIQGSRISSQVQKNQLILTSWLCKANKHYLVALRSATSLSSSSSFSFICARHKFVSLRTPALSTPSVLIGGRISTIT